MVAPGLHTAQRLRTLAIAGAIAIAGCRSRTVSTAAPTAAPVVRVDDDRQMHRFVTPPRFTDLLRWPRLLLVLPAIDEHLGKLVHDQALVGLAAGVVIDGRLVWSAGYGLRARDSKDPVRRDTVFRIASLTKVFTAMAILQLRDRGVLELDDPAADHLPALRTIAYPSGDAHEITIREILTHSAGLPRDADVSRRAAPLQSDELIAALDGLGLGHAGDTTVWYSNLGYQILGLLIARATATPYTGYVRREILAPLGMRDATWDPRTVPTSRLATGYEVRRGDFVARERPTPLGAAAASGELWASVEDLAALAAFQLDAWPPRAGPDEGVLRRATVRESHRVALLGSLRASVGDEGKGLDAFATAAALGWQVREDCRLGHVVWHNGALDGHRSALYMLPQHGVAVILLGNTEYPLDAPARTVLELMAKSGGLVERTPTPVPELDALALAWHGLLESWDERAFRYDWVASRHDEIDDVEDQRARMQAVAARLGKCEAPVRSKVIGPYHAEFVLECEQGTAVLDLTSASSAPARIIRDRVELHGVAPDPAVVAAASRVLALRQQWDETAMTELFAPVLRRPAFRRGLARQHAAAGPCTLGKAQVSTPFGARFALRCERGNGSITVVLDRGQGRIVDVDTEMDRPPMPRCGEDP